MVNIYRHVYGPMPARRQGRAVGIDLFRKKICTFDCVYCEVGRTEVLTSELEVFADSNTIFNEIDDFLSKDRNITSITFAGCGEPTLHKELEKIIIGVKERAQVPVTVLTNSSLIDKKCVQNALLHADVILPSLDSARQATFEKMNRPMKGFYVERIINGLVDFRVKYKGLIWLEVFFVDGINDTEADISALNSAISKIKPDKVQLNTVQRPGTESWAKPLSKSRLEKIADQIHGNVEVIASGEINLS